MADENIELLKEIVALLKQQAEERRKVMDDVVDTLPGRPDWKKRQDETDQRMKELREKAEQHRQELRAYQDSVLSELRKISSLLEQLRQRSDGAG